MTWVLTDEEYEAVRKIAPEKRYRHFLSRVADEERLWLLGDEGGEIAQATDEQGADYVPVWPHERYALSERREDWERYTIGEIDVHEFVEQALSDLERDGVGVAVFPVLGNGAWTVTVAELRADLVEALSQY